MNDWLALCLVISFVCGILALAGWLAERGKQVGDSFRRRWGGSDAKYQDKEIDL